MIPLNIDDALRDPKLLGASLGDPKTWATWLAVLRAAFGLKLNRQDKRSFDAVARRQSPKRRVRELWAVVGRRGGKSRIAALLAVFFAVFIPHKLAAGETGVVAVISASKDQARVVFDYALGALMASPVLANEVADSTRDEIRLANGIVIAIQSASYRTVRGRTLVAAIFDETALWRDDQSANPDVEIYRAVRPALLTTRGMLIGISTGYRKIGLLYDKHRDHFGVDDPNVLVISGSSEQFNPTLDKDELATDRAADPEAAISEYDGGFRSDLAAFLDDVAIEAAVDHGRPLELPPKPNMRYVAFADPSGGRHDAFTVCIGHVEEDRIVADVIRGIAAPFDPASVTDEFGKLLKNYGLTTVVSDRYASEWAASAWQDAGIKHQASELSKSELYLEGLPEFMRGSIRIPDHGKLTRELRLLERRTARSGRDSVDHGRSGSDDYANALFGMIRLATARQTIVSWGTVGDGAGAVSFREENQRRRWSRHPGINAATGRREFAKSER